MSSDTFRKIIEGQDGPSLEEVIDTPLAETWAAAEKKLGHPIKCVRKLCGGEPLPPPKEKPVSIDRKFKIRARSVKSGNSYDESTAVLFLAKDLAFLDTLPDYRDHCEARGAGPDQLKAVDLMIDRVREYQKSHPELVKVPDVDPAAEPEALQP